MKPETLLAVDWLQPLFHQIAVFDCALEKKILLACCLGCSLFCCYRPVFAKLWCCAGVEDASVEVEVELLQHD